MTPISTSTCISHSRGRILTARVAHISATHLKTMRMTSIIYGDCAYRSSRRPAATINYVAISTTPGVALIRSLNQCMVVSRITLALANAWASHGHASSLARRCGTPQRAPFASPLTANGTWWVLAQHFIVQAALHLLTIFINR